MNGADPYSALHQQQQAGGNAAPAGGGGSTPGLAASSAFSTAASSQSASRAASGTNGNGGQTGFPILDKHAKPLVGSDTATAVSGFVCCFVVTLCDTENVVIVRAFFPERWAIYGRMASPVSGRGVCAAVLENAFLRIKFRGVGRVHVLF